MAVICAVGSLTTVLFFPELDHMHLYIKGRSTTLQLCVMFSTCGHMMLSDRHKDFLPIPHTGFKAVSEEFPILALVSE